MNSFGKRTKPDVAKVWMSMRGMSEGFIGLMIRLWPPVIGQKKNAPNSNFFRGARRGGSDQVGGCRQHDGASSSDRVSVLPRSVQARVFLIRCSCPHIARLQCPGAEVWSQE